MAFQSVWHFTKIPTDIINIIEKDLKENFESNMSDSRLANDIIDKNKRNSKNSWIPTTNWIPGFLWHYVNKANNDNFLYDLSNIDGESLQYTKYETGEYYTWHNDAGIENFYKPDNSDPRLNFVVQNTEVVRKLSFVVQLSDPEDYTGGNLQILSDSGRSYFAPREKGTIIFFDSRTKHRVLKVKSGVRKSLVGWVVGPRWK